MNQLLLNGNLYLNTEMTVKDSPDEDMCVIVHAIEEKFEKEFGIKLCVHYAELTDENDNKLGGYET